MLFLILTNFGSYTYLVVRIELLLIFKHNLSQ